MEAFASLPLWAKGQKELKMSSAEPHEPGDIEPRVTWYRNPAEQPVALGFADAVDRDRGLQMAVIGITGFGADRVDMMFDTHVTDERFLKRYGRNPDPGELQRLCDNEGACEIGLTTDAIFCSVMWRDSDRMVTVSVPYHVDKRRTEVEFVTDAKARKARRTNRQLVRDGGRWFQVERTVHWMDDRITWFDSDGNGQRVEGRIVDVIRRAFSQPIVDGVSFEADRTMIDHAIVAVLTSAGFAIAVPKDDPLLTERLTSMLETPSTRQLAAELRERLRNEAVRSHESDEAERARRQALRVDGAPTEEDKERVVKP